MFYRLKRKFFESQFDFACRGIKQSAPVISDSNEAFLLSLLHRAAVIQYLIAVKSIARFTSGWDYVVLSDGSLTEQNIALLRQHIKGITIIQIADASDSRLPRGGCWERLALVSRLSEQKYVVQMDSDTITRGAVPEIQEFVSGETPFTLAGHPSTRIVSCQTISDGWKDMNAVAVQSQAEKAMGTFAARWPKYASGCAAFSGYPRKSLPINGVVGVSEAFTETLGDTWQAWGSEQFASNLLIANMPGATILPYPRYASYVPKHDSDLQRSSFIHFYGTNRYANGRYLQWSKQISKPDFFETENAAR